jgi:hypothetical protein
MDPQLRIQGKNPHDATQQQNTPDLILRVYGSANVYLKHHLS